MSDWTSIKVRKEIRDKINELKGDMTHDEFLTKILSRDDGTLVNDVVEVERERYCMELHYQCLDAKNNILFASDYRLSFREVVNAGVGDVFAPEMKNSRYFIKNSAEVVFNDGNSALLRVKFETRTVSEHYVEYEMVHIKFF